MLEGPDLERDSGQLTLTSGALEGCDELACRLEDKDGFVVCSISILFDSNPEDRPTPSIDFADFGNATATAVGAKRFNFGSYCPSDTR